MAAQTLIASENKRYLERKDLSLMIPGRADGSDLQFTVRNMSQTGFLAACSVHLAADAVVEIDLPRVGTRAARVVWTGDGVLGFNFAEPITKGALSAALLQGDLPQGDDPATSPIHDPANPMWDTAAEAGSHEKLPLRSRMWLIVATATLPWIALYLALFGF